MADARQVRRARPVGAAGRLVQQLLHVADRGRRGDRHREEVHDVGDVVGHLPERALEGNEGADRDLALGGEIGADREHDQVQQQHRDRHSALDHGREEHCVRDLPPGLVVAEAEPAEHLAVQAERLDHRLGSDVLLDHAEQRGFVELLLVIGLHRLGRQDAWADQRDREHQQRDRGELPVEEQHQDDAGDELEQRQRSAVGEGLDHAFEGRHVDREARQDLAALGALKIGRRQVLHVIEQTGADV